MPRFGHELFRRFRHQSGLVIPLVLDDRVAGAFYLVWWTARRQLTAREEGQDKDVQQAMEAGAAAYFVKADLSLQALVQRIEDALAARGV